MSKFQFDRRQDLPENHFQASGASWVLLMTIILKLIIIIVIIIIIIIIIIICDLALWSCFVFVFAFLASAMF